MEPEEILIDKAIMNQKYNSKETIIPGNKMYYRHVVIKNMIQAQKADI